jgi:hypothetical protein
VCHGTKHHRRHHRHGYRRFGASLPHAKVTLTNLDAKEVRTATTTAAGDYTFTQLGPGSYFIQVSQSGFKNFIIPKISLSASAREDAKPQPGTINDWMIDGLDNNERVIGIAGSGHRSQAMPLPRNTANCGKNYCVIVLYR